MATIQTSIRMHDGMTPAFKNVNKALNSVNSAFQKLQNLSSKGFNANTIKSIATDLGRVQNYLGKTQSTLEGVRQKTLQNRNAQKQHNQSIREGSSAASSLWSKLKSIFGLYMGVQAVGGIIKTADELTMTTARLNLMTGSLEETKKVQDQIYEAAMRSRAGYLHTADAVAKLRLRAGQIFKTNDEAVAFSETLNKMFAIAGASHSEMYSATLQLTQALGSGVLRGEEFRAVFEAAPNVMQAVADYMNLPIGKLREIANEGAISADIVKNAMFKAAEQVDEQFKSIPVTWTQVWTAIKNYTIKITEPILERIRDITASERFIKFANSVANVMAILANILGGIFNVITATVAFIYDNWSFIEAILIGLATVYLPTIISLLWAKVTALWAAATAWLVVNWHILLIAVAIAGVILIIRHLGITFADVCGFIAGAVMWCISTIVNTFVYMYNTCLHIIDSIANAAITVGEVVYNAFTGGFTGWIAGVKSALWSFVNWAYSIIKPLVSVWDKIKGTNIAGELQAKIDNNISKGTTSNYTKFNRSNVLGKYGMTPMDGVAAYNKGFKWGSGIGDKISDWTSSITNKLGLAPGGNGLNDLGKALTGGFGNDNPALDNISKNTDSMANSLAASDEDLSYMRDLAEREAINRYTLTDLKVEQNNNNNFANGVDANGMLDLLKRILHEGVQSTANGVHI